MYSKRPTVLLEHQELYARKGKIPGRRMNYLVQPGRAKVIRPGHDITLVTYSATTIQALEAARLLEKEGVDVEIIDLRTLDRSDTDFKLIGRSLEKTGRMLTVEQAPRCGSIGPHIITECVVRFDRHLKSPPRLIAGPSVPVPVSKPLEALCFPDAEMIQHKILDWVRS